VELVETMLRNQLVAAIGKVVSPVDFSNYMRFHNRKLFLEAYEPKPFCYAVRRPEHYPEGTLSIEGQLADGSIAQPILTSVRAVEPVHAMRFAIDDPTARCLPPGVPRVHSVGLFPIQIAQLPDHIIILYEYMNVFRVIPLNVPHPEDLEPSYLGDSVGHWEGDTLVVDITSFNDRTWLIGAGTFHGENLHITEKWNRVSTDRIDYEATMEDPDVLTKPWVYRQTLMLREGTRLREYVCPENNLDLERYEKLVNDGVDFQRQ
jgi:hypothetical protein